MINSVETESDELESDNSVTAILMKLSLNFENGLVSDKENGKDLPAVFTKCKTMPNKQPTKNVEVFLFITSKVHGFHIQI